MNQHKPELSHQDRIRQELIAVGMNNYGLLKAESRHLPKIIHEDEHIGGVIYGRHQQSGSGMLVATNTRVIFLDYKLLFKKSDELTYDVVSGVSINQMQAFAGVVLHTRLGDFELRFVNSKSAKIFASFIESKLMRDRTKTSTQSEKESPKKAIKDSSFVRPTQFAPDAKDFLITHELGVLSTANDNQPQGAAVYYAVDDNNYLYIVTKNKTDKANNIQNNHRVALTIYDSNTAQTLQIQGTAHIEADPEITTKVYEKIIQPRLYGTQMQLPPVTQIPAGDYVIICVSPSSCSFSTYKNGEDQ